MELSWFLGCAFERDRKGGVLRASQRAFIESAVSRYGVGAVSDLLASQSAYLGPRRNDEPVCDKPVRAAVNLGLVFVRDGNRKLSVYVGLGLRQ